MYEGVTISFKDIFIEKKIQSNIEELIEHKILQINNKITEYYNSIIKLIIIFLKVKYCQNYLHLDQILLIMF